MGNMDNYDMLVKNRCRKKVRRFINKTFKKNKISQLRVLCLPGEQALEIYNIYDKLGIPRSNITCLEKDKKIYDILRKKELGVNLINIDFKDFVESYHNTFDIVSLDFTGQLGSYENDIYKMHLRGFFSDKCVIYTNFLGHRESQLTQGYYYEALWRIITKDVGEFDLMKLAANGEIEKTKKEMQKLNDKLTEETIQQARDWGIYLALLRVFTSGRKNSLLSKIIFEDERVSEFDKKMKKLCEENDYRLENDTSEVGKILNQIKKCTDNKDDIVSENTRRFFKAVLSEKIYPYIPGHYSDKEKDIICEIIEYGIDRYITNAHNVLNTDSFKYISKNGAPMYSDIFYLSRTTDYNFLGEYLGNRDSIEDQSSDEVLNGLLMYDEDTLMDVVKKIKSIHDSERSYLKSMGNLLDGNFPTRESLGSESIITNNINKNKSKTRKYVKSKKPVIHKPIVIKASDDQKKKAIELLNSNAGTDKEIADMVGVRPRQVSAWKAHITMGTYAK